MKNTRKGVHLAVALAAVTLAAATSSAYGEGSSAEADPTHHKIAFENDCVKVTRASYAPGDKSDNMYDQKGMVVVILTEVEKFRRIGADGKGTDLPTRSPGDT